MALLKSVSLVMLDVEYLRSYVDAVPVLLSSPGEVQFRLADVWVIFVAVRFVMIAGGVVSGVAA